MRRTEENLSIWNEKFNLDGGSAYKQVLTAIYLGKLKLFLFHDPYHKYSEALSNYLTDASMVSPFFFM